MNSSAKKILQISGLALFFLLIIVYAIFGSSDLIFGVKIKKVNIDGEPAESGVKVNNSILKVTGSAKNATNLTLDGREISINLSGEFDETIALLPGYNIITIVAKDKFGRGDQKNYKLIYEPSAE